MFFITRKLIQPLLGNAGNPLHRIPVFETILGAFHKRRVDDRRSNASSRLTILAVAPRSFWKSTRRAPTQAGILQDYRDILHYTLRRWPNATITLYGHSLGGSAAACLLSKLHDVARCPPLESNAVGQQSAPSYDRVRGLILENAFTSIPDMVRELYPSRWLPYYHLGPLAVDKWDAVAALKAAGDREHEAHSSVLSRLRHDMLVLSSEKDEIVPPSMGEIIVNAAGEAVGDGAMGDAEWKTRRMVVQTALHENAYLFPKWSREIVTYIRSV